MADSPFPKGVNLPSQDSPSRYRFVPPFPALGDDEGSSFEEPIFIGHAGDHSRRLFVVERKGRIFVFENRADIKPEEVKVFLDIRNLVATEWWEEGLLGLAFDPRFKENGYFYVYFTRRIPRLEAVIRRYTAKSGPTHQTADLTSGLDILSIPFHQWEHLGGMMAFGPDRMLYVGIGDAVAPDKEEEVETHGKSLLGSIIRIDVSSATSAKPYRIPEDNPFVGIKNGPREEIWAYGLRSQWRWSFDSKTGWLWAADAGHHSREEINIIEKGGDYGWPFYEGTLRFKKRELETPPFQPVPVPRAPFFEYSHEQGLLCVIGGYVYRGKNIPSLVGSYIYGDFTPLPDGNPIWALKFDESKRTVLKNEKISRLGRLSSFGVDEEGEIYVLSVKEGFLGKLTEIPLPPLDPESDIPTKLSQTGLFLDLPSLTPRAGLNPYQPEKSFWSDGAKKTRWVLKAKSTDLAEGTTPEIFSVGSVFVKHFASDLSQKPIETRLLVHGHEGWRGYSYRWNEKGTDAELVGPEGTSFELTPPQSTSAHHAQGVKQWTIPGRNQCFNCHNQTAGIILGHTAAHQKHHPQPRTLEQQASQYLRVNCAYCHQPDGVFRLNFDLRTVEGMRALINAPAVTGDLGLSGAKLVSPGDKDRSVLWHRLQNTTGTAMPPLGRHTVDPEGIKLIEEWITSVGESNQETKPETQP